MKKDLTKATELLKAGNENREKQLTYIIRLNNIEERINEHILSAEPIASVEELYERFINTCNFLDEYREAARNYVLSSFEDQELMIKTIRELVK